MERNKVLKFVTRFLKEKRLVRAYLRGEITKKELESHGVKLANPIKI